jgi:Zn-dependent protease with chaperone function
MRITITAMLLMAALYTFGQTTTLQLRHYTFPKTIPQKYIVDPIADYEKLMEVEVPKSMKASEYQRYAEQVSFQKANTFLSGELYYGWTELETYLNEVLKKVAPEKYKTKANLHAYPTRWTEFNAFSIHDGTFYVNIGLIADVKNEAALACILGHEIVHYQKQHVRSGVTRLMRANSKAKRNDNQELMLNNAHNNRGNEKFADSLGAIYAANAGYDLNQGTSNFYSFLMMEKLESLKNSKDDDILDEDEKSEMDEDQSPDEVDDDNVKNSDENNDNIWASHPDLKRRIKYYAKFAAKFNNENPKKYLVGRKQFKDLQDKARLEVLANLFENNYYRSCTRRAMLYHLQDPQNTSYVYYLAESIRRATFLDNELKSKPFLCEDISTTKFPNIKKGILANIKFLTLDTVLLKTFVPDYLIVTNSTDKPLFRTWFQAFKYFGSLIDTMQIAEGYLTLALATTDMDVRKEWVDKYVADNTTLYKTYAKALVANKLYSKIEENTKELLFNSGFTFIEDHKYGYQIKNILSNKKQTHCIGLTNELISKKFKNKESFVFNDIIKEDLPKALRYRNAVLTSILFENSKTFQNNKVKEQKLNTKTKKTSTDEEDENKVDVDEEKTKTDKATKPTPKTNSSKPKEKEEMDDAELPYWNGLLPKKNDAIYKYSESQLFLLSPDIWTLFYQEKLSSIEWLRVTAFNDKTRITGLYIPIGLYLIPFLTPFLPLYEISARYSFGSKKYSYKINYFSCTPILKTKANFYSQSIVKYKMSDIHLKISIYDALKTKEIKKQKAQTK